MTSGATDGVLDLAVQWCRPEDPELAAEYERLFVGPGRVPCPPYESLWRRDVPARLQGSLFGPCVPDLESCYAGLGVRVPPGRGELADHIAVELEALALALAHPGFDAVARALLCDHLSKWVPSFCDAVVEHTETAFYRDLAERTTHRVVELHHRVHPPDG